jgi:SAM-dependent methyltransferase
MRASGASVREDFDGIARALGAAGAGDDVPPYERALLGHLPAACDRVLEVGCGDGALTRQVARRARAVLALDLSPEMIRLARARSAGCDNIDFRVADVTATELPPRAFDAVLSVATLHHVPLGPTLTRLAAAVRPGGVLLIQDLVRRPGVRHLPVNALAWLARRLRLAPGPRHGRRGAGVAALYAAHGRGERYLTPAEAARAYAQLLPGTRVIHHLAWRYTAVWRRGAGT